MNIRSPRITGHLEFMIDTGSPFTVIAPKDLLKFRIVLRSLSRAGGSIVSVAGFKFRRHEMGEIDIRLRTAKSFISFKSSLFSMIAPTKLSDMEDNRLQAIPSILGNDFLEDHNAAVYFDPATLEAYLDLKNESDPDS
jgi:hypothetical protein